MAGLTNGRLGDHWSTELDPRIPLSSEGSPASNTRSTARAQAYALRNPRYFETETTETIAFNRRELDSQSANVVGFNRRHARDHPASSGEGHRDYIKISMIVAVALLVCLTAFRIVSIMLPDGPTVTKKSNRFSHVYVLPDDFDENDIPPIWRGVAQLD